jgi:ABC-type nitrate/sulfonate/bicarbonate transport system substrate-binding protein
MDRVQLYLLRGICQLPGYVAHEKGFFRQQGVTVDIHIPATAWTVPDLLESPQNRFAVIPWTRVAAATNKDLVLICGSGVEEAAIVLRSGLRVSDVKSVAVPVAGGMKDLTAMALLNELGWGQAELLRQPSGDGAIIALFGQGVDAASMVEPYATMLEGLGVGKTIRRTGDLWPGAPGCSLSTSANLVGDDPDLVQRMVTAYVQGARYVEANPQESAIIASRYIGINADFIRDALRVNHPDVGAILNTASMQLILSLMQRLGYIETIPHGFCNSSFLEQAQPSSSAGCE